MSCKLKSTPDRPVQLRYDNIIKIRCALLAPSSLLSLSLCQGQVGLIIIRLPRNPVKTDPGPRVDTWPWGHQCLRGHRRTGRFTLPLIYGLRDENLCRIKPRARGITAFYFCISREARKKFLACADRVSPPPQSRFPPSEFRRTALIAGVSGPQILTFLVTRNN